MMVILNFGGGGRKIQGNYSDNYTKNAFTPGFKPNGYDSLGSIPLRLRGVSEDSFGISGPGGTVFAFITSITLAMFSCLGTDLVAMTAGEAKHPWKDIPITMSFVYLVPLTMYPFAMFAAGANVNYANPNLSKMWAKSNISTRSPFIVAAEESSLTALPKVLNAFFIVSAYTTANNDLYGASRSVFMLSQQYLPRRIANIFGRTNNGHTPLAAILLCSALGFLSLIGLADKSGSQPSITLSELYTGTATCINLFLCITFLRFKAGLDRLAKRRIFSREHPLYRSRLFKSRWQPLPAYIGIIGSAFVIIWSGIPPLVILVTKGSINRSSTSGTQLKSTISLLFDVIGAYIGPLFFASLYLSYKYIFPRTSRVDIRNLTVEDYVLEDLSSIELEGPTSTPPVPRHRFGSHEMDAQNDNLVGPTGMFQDPFKEEQMHLSVSMDPDMQEEIETEAARNNERARIRQILERRPERMRRGICREIWSFVMTDKD
ncbi:Amino acid transporter [Pyrenophora tritici-repentis]|nr:Amino acid transporter [Pyrenophora tritici-repentis]